MYNAMELFTQYKIYLKKASVATYLLKIDFAYNIYIFFQI